MATRIRSPSSMSPKSPPAPATMTWIDLVPPPAEAPPPASALPAASGDQTQLVADQTAPRAGTSAVPGTPAPDTGKAEARRPAEAERRDRSTLHARLAD